MNSYFLVFKKNVFSISNKDFGFDKSVKTIIESSAESQINTGKMIVSLLKLVGKLGVEIKTSHKVKDIESGADFVRIGHDLLPLEAKQVCICTNAFSENLPKGFDIKPGKGQVLVTKPIKKLTLINPHYSRVFVNNTG